MHDAVTTIECATAEEAIAALRQTLTNREHGRRREDRWLWRGQSNSTWDLIPSAFRAGAVLGYETHHAREVTGADLGGIDQHTAEFFAVYEFLHLADKLGLHVPGDTAVFRINDAFAETVGKQVGRKWPPHHILEVMALAQHHGVPTRLLDFSYRYSVAAYFAARGIVDGSKHEKLSIWGIDYDFITKAQYDRGSDSIVRVTVPRAFNRNLHAQHGLFLVDLWAGAEGPDGPLPAGLNHQIAQLAQEAWSSGKIHPSWKPIVKVDVAATVAQDLLDLLALDGYDEAHLMPSFDSVLRELKRRQTAWRAESIVYKVQPNDE
jgi:hypothetical protein